MTKLFRSSVSDHRAAKNGKAGQQAARRWGRFILAAVAFCILAGLAVLLHRSLRDMSGTSGRSRAPKRPRVPDYEPLELPEFDGNLSVRTLQVCRH